MIINHLENNDNDQALSSEAQVNALIEDFDKAHRTLANKCDKRDVLRRGSRLYGDMKETNKSLFFWRYADRKVIMKKRVSSGRWLPLGRSFMRQ